jgi:hypothetical protein
MALTGLEREFLERLSAEPWASPPLFDHSLALQLPFLKISESMGNHDSKIVGAGCVG